MARTTRATAANKESQPCTTCNVLDDAEMVLCDNCDQPHHLACVKVDERIRELPWSCAACIKKAASRSRLTSRDDTAAATNDPSKVKRVVATKTVNEEQLLKRLEKQSEQTNTAVKECERLATENAALKERLEKEAQRIASEAQRLAEEKKQAEELLNKAEEERKLAELLKVQAAEELRLVEETKATTERERQELETEKSSLQTLRSQSDSNSKLNSSSNFSCERDSPLKDQSIEDRLRRIDERQQEMSERLSLVISKPSTTEFAKAVVDGIRSSISPDLLQQQLAAGQVGAINPFDASFVNATLSSSNSSNFDHLATAMGRKYLQDLPEFNGDERAWAFFEAVYNSTTEEGKFQDVHNLARLRKALKPPARNLVLNELLYGTNASDVMKLLKEVYGKPQKLNVTLMDELLRMPKISSQTDVKLRDFAIEVKRYAAVMKGSGLSEELKCGYNLSKLAEKLHFSHYKEWVKLKGEKPAADICDFGEFLMEKVKEVPPSMFSGQQGTSTTFGARNDDQFRNRRVNIHGAPSSNSCCVCNGVHGIWKCDEFERMSAEERWNVVMSKRLCFGCLGSGHQSADCRSRRVCNIDGCVRSHHKLLHNNSSNYRSNDTRPNRGKAGRSNDSAGHPVHHILRPDATEFEQKTSNPDEVRTEQQMSHIDSSAVLFKISPVQVEGVNGNVVDTFAFFDDGSSLTMIEEDLALELGLEGPVETLKLQWTKGITRCEQSSCVTLKISSKEGKCKHVLKEVYTVSNLDLPQQSIDAKALSDRFSHLSGIPLHNVNAAKPKILIGLRHPLFLASFETRTGGPEDPVAAKMLLGWCVYGQTAPSMGITTLAFHNQSMSSSLKSMSPQDEELHNLVKYHFSVDSFGTTPLKHDLVNIEHRRSLDIMSSTLRKVGERYEIGLLWKNDDVKLPDSYPMAMKRLENEERSLKKRNLLEWKNAHIRDLVAKGFARALTAEELKRKWPRLWYCPRFVVVNQNKQPPKPRDVADVAACVKGVSLNSRLLKGPDNLAPMLGGIFKFRENRIAVNGDVKEMFHQIQIKEQDQQCQRFLWRDGKTSCTPTTYVMTAMMFGPTCSPSCAQFVKNSHAEKFREKCPEAVNGIIDKTYVDDYFNSHDTVEEAHRVTQDAIDIFKSGGFPLVNVQSNSKKLLELLGSDVVKETLVNMSPEEADSFVTKVLGLHWNTFPDVLTFKLAEDETLKKTSQDENFRPTKRQMLKTLMKIFDPLGLIAHYLIRGKIALQEVWREGCGWDEPIPVSLLPMWREFAMELKNIENLKIPRQYAPINAALSKIMLVIFVDASEKAYGASAYFRFDVNGKVYVAHVMGKSKVAPIKKLTTPQLELLAAVLGIRLAELIKRLHTFLIIETIFLSDSKCVISWICTKKYDFKSFVAVRIGEILDCSSRRQWYYVPSKENVADDATKWKDASMGDGTTRWFTGPAYMQLPIEQWPIKQACEYDDEDVTTETRLMVHAKAQSNSCELFSVLDDISPRFKSRWSSFVRVVAFTVRIIRRKRGNKFISPIEFQEAQNVVFRKIQLEAFPSEVAALCPEVESKQQGVHNAGDSVSTQTNPVNTTQTNPVNNTKTNPVNIDSDHDVTLRRVRKTVEKSSSIRNLSPFMKADDLVIRMSSRSQKARLSYAARNPAILPNQHPLVDLLIQHMHEKNFHMGEESTIADLREVAWIVDIRAAVRRIKRHCQLCKILSAIPVAPIMGEFPTSRLEFGVRPFTHSGMDGFGPFDVKFGRGTVKRYGLIFTCLTYRAVHLEMLRDMSTDQCIKSIRRFLARRGPCKHFYSDNGKNFVGSHNQLNRDLKDLAEELGEALANKFKIQWHFIPAYSPWFGGAWERLIQSIKKCIDFIMVENVPREDVFEDALIEAEMFMNRRPLTHIPIDHEDDKALTPNTVLWGDDDDSTALAPGSFNEGDAVSTKAYRRVQHLANKYMSRWVKEYLPEITRRTKWYEYTRPIEVGDIVIVTEVNQPRDAWKKGRVIKVHPGTDGEIRAADVKLADGSIKPSRSVGRLAVLDVKGSSSIVTTRK
jgi:hypothetical protein